MQFHAFMTDWVSAVRDFIAPQYRPERHYMRGPGPKCREMKAASAGASFVAMAE